MELSHEVRQLMETLPEFSGTVMLRGDDRPHLHVGYGLANRSDRTPNAADTRFATASGSKIFTAVAICRLAEQGLLSFDASIANYIDLSDTSFSRDVTVHHLLTHSAGIPDYFDEATMTDYGALWAANPMYAMESPEHFLPMFRKQPMKFRPGTQFAYNNAGFILLGLIIESVTGASFRTYIQQHVFDVCGMSDSGYFRLDRLPSRTAIGYIDDPDGKGWRTHIFSIPVIGQPDGGAYTTTGDMDKFWSALLSYRLLGEGATRKMLNPHIKAGPHTSYGYGVWITVIEGEIFKYFVMGCDPGVGLESSVYPKSSLRAHVISNTTDGASEAARKIDDLIFNLNIEEA